MKLLRNLVFLSVVLEVLSGLSSEATAGEGGFNGGGGGAAVCRDRNHKIRRAYLIDTFEGRYRFNYKIVQSTKPEREQLLTAMARVKDEWQRTLLIDFTSQVMGAAQFLPPNVGFAPTTDLGSAYGVIVPAGCGIEPVGVYERDGSLKISREVYRALSKTDRAAFFLHEGIYKLARDTSKQTDSMQSRQAVAALFASSASSDLIYQLLSNVAFNLATDIDQLPDYYDYIKVPVISSAATSSITLRIHPLGDGSRKFQAVFFADQGQCSSASPKGCSIVEVGAEAKDLTLSRTSYRTFLSFVARFENDAAYDGKPAPIRVEVIDSFGVKTGQMEFDLQDLRYGIGRPRLPLLTIAYRGRTLPAVPQPR